MKVLVSGKGGQLATELARTLPSGCQLVSLSAAELDITDRSAVLERIASESPDLVINAAAYTMVDKAETEEDLATLVNGDGAGNLARGASDAGARFIHVSTDFVFNGCNHRPYLVTDQPDPVSAYGRSKLAGEQIVQEVLGSRALVVRTAWVYASHGGNFIRTMLRLMSERDEISVVADQVGSPTWARTLAASLWKLSEADATGIHHVTDSGVCSWYDLAVAIRDLGVRFGLLNGAEVRPIRTEDYPVPAPRPAYSVLDKTVTAKAIGEDFPHWRASLEHCLDEIATAGG